MSKKAPAGVYSCDINEIAAGLERLGRDSQYLEWTPEGVVSRFFEGRRARVDFTLPAVANREAYLSVSQLDYLLSLDFEQVEATHGWALTARHLYLVDCYRVKRRQKQALETARLHRQAAEAFRSQPRESQLAANVSKVTDGLSTVAEKALGQITLSSHQEASRSRLLGRKAKLWAALAAFALASLVGVSATSDPAETAPADAAASYEPLQPGRQPAESLSEAAPAMSAVSLSLGATAGAAPVEAADLMSPADEPSQSTTFEAAATPEPSVVVEPAAAEAVAPVTTEALPVVEPPVLAPIAELELDRILAPEPELPTELAPTDSTELATQASVDDIALANIDIVQQQPDSEPSGTNASPAADQLPAPVAETEPKVEVAPEAVDQSPAPVVEVKPEAAVTPEAVESVAPSYSLTGEQIGWLEAVGIPESDWGYVDYIFTKESNWRPWLWSSVDVKSFGLCQANLLVHEVPEGYMDDPVVQVRWCNDYAHKRYGGWRQAYEFWKENHWW